MKISPDGREWLNDPGDERDIPEEELFGDFASAGITPERLAETAVTEDDQAFIVRYRKWLAEGNWPPADDPEGD